MKNHAKLVAFARKLSLKYLEKLAIDAEQIRPQVQQAIQTALANAASQGNQGIMSFQKMQKQDNCGLAFDVTRNGSDVTVSNLATNPPDVSGKYMPLVDQIKNYLQKYLDLFPTMYAGGGVEYDNFTIRCEYPAPGTTPIAQG